MVVSDSEYERRVSMFQRTVQPDGSNRRIHAMTFRRVHGRISSQPLCQKVHIFFSDVTGRCLKRVLTSSDSGRRSSFSEGIGVTPGGKLEAGCAGVIDEVRCTG